MENISLAIVTDDRDYGKALGLSLLSVYGRFTLSIMEEKDYAEQSRIKKFDAILWDGEGFDSQDERIILLTEGEGSSDRQAPEEKPALCKYAGGQAAAAEILGIYRQMTGKRQVSAAGKEAVILAFSSWQGGSGCSVLAAATGREMSLMYGMRVFYISFEPVESTCAVIGYGEGRGGAGRYLYEMNREYGSAAVEEHVTKDDFGVEAFTPARGRNPLGCLNFREAEELLSSVEEAGLYDAIIADLGTNILEGSMAIMERADKICAVYAEGGPDHKRDSYIKHLRISCGEDLDKKLIFVKNMYTGREEKRGDEICIRAEEAIGYGEAPEGGFGEDISRLAARIFES